MSATGKTKTTTRIQLKGGFTEKGVRAALGLNFKDVLPASENASGQIVKHARTSDQCSDMSMTLMFERFIVRMESTNCFFNIMFKLSLGNQ